MQSARISSVALYCIPLKKPFYKQEDVSLLGTIRLTNLTKTWLKAYAVFYCKIKTGSLL